MGPVSKWTHVARILGWTCRRGSVCPHDGEHPSTGLDECGRRRVFAVARVREHDSQILRVAVGGGADWAVLDVHLHVRGNVAAVARVKNNGADICA